KDDLQIKGLWYKRGSQTISNPRPENFPDLGALPMPAWDLLPMDKYRAHNWHCFQHIDQRQPYAVIYTSLGCPYTCSFCCINAVFGRPGIRYRPPEKVVEEIDYLVKRYKVKNIKILDEIFALKPAQVEEFCDRVIALGHDLNFWVYGRIDTVKEHMVHKMKQAGINWLAYGIEAGSKKVRDGVSKGRFDKEEVRKVVQFTHDAGIHIVANFIFGLPDDDFETMQETLDLAKELNCEYANFYCTMAYPGSKLYEDAVKQNIPLPKTWNGYAQFSEDTLPLPTKHLSSGQVLRFRDQAFDQYYSDPGYLEMMMKKFGAKTVEHVQEMCSVKLKRKYYDFDGQFRFQNNQT
ncbi:MAG: radical SAM protein, partial [Candidatus Omnitrophota bacterium]